MRDLGILPTRQSMESMKAQAMSPHSRRHFLTSSINLLTPTGTGPTITAWMIWSLSEFSADPTYTTLNSSSVYKKSVHTQLVQARHAIKATYPLEGMTGLQMLFQIGNHQKICKDCLESAIDGRLISQGIRPKASNPPTFPRLTWTSIMFTRVILKPSPRAISRYPPQVPTSLTTTSSKSGIYFSDHSRQQASEAIPQIKPIRTRRVALNGHPKFLRDPAHLEFQPIEEKAQERS